MNRLKSIRKAPRPRQERRSDNPPFIPSWQNGLPCAHFSLLHSCCRSPLAVVSPGLPRLAPPPASTSSASSSCIAAFLMSFGRSPAVRTARSSGSTRAKATASRASPRLRPCRTARTLSAGSIAGAIRGPSLHHPEGSPTVPTNSRLRRKRTGRAGGRDSKLQPCYPATPMQETELWLKPTPRTLSGLRRWSMPAAWLIIMLLAAPLLAACGKRGAPSPPGPPSQVTFPKTYPTQ